MSHQSRETQTIVLSLHSLLFSIKQNAKSDGHRKRNEKGDNEHDGHSLVKEKTYF